MAPSRKELYVVDWAAPAFSAEGGVVLIFWQPFALQQPASARAIQVISSPANPSGHALVARASQQKYTPINSRIIRINRQPFSILFMILFYTFF
jgi:hypothetical protein